MKIVVSQIWNVKAEGAVATYDGFIVIDVSRDELLVEDLRAGRWLHDHVCLEIEFGREVVERRVASIVRCAFKALRLWPVADAWSTTALGKNEAGYDYCSSASFGFD